VRAQSVGVGYVLTGHSERRSIYGEPDELINKKTLKACATLLAQRALALTRLLHARARSLTRASLCGAWPARRRC
jgi:hypothetical protein